MLTNAIQIQAFITSLLNSCNNFINNLHAISFSFLQTIFSMLLSRFSRVRLCDPRWQPTRLTRPRDSPGKNTGVGCHFLLQCMKVKSESEVAQSCPTLATSWTAAHQAHPWDFPGKSTGVGCHCLLLCRASQNL